MPCECGSGTPRCGTLQRLGWLSLVCAKTRLRERWARKWSASAGTLKFYDSISPLLVMEEMVASGFDPVLLAIRMPLHRAPRVLRRDGHCSPPMATTSSILAGMKGSGIYAWNCLVPLLEGSLQDSCFCHAGLWERLGAAGGAQCGHCCSRACVQCRPVCRRRIRRARAQGLLEKHVVLRRATRHCVRMAKLSARGLQFEMEKSVRDLGVGGRRGRRTATKKQRVPKMARRARRLKKLAAWNTKA